MTTDTQIAEVQSLPTVQAYITAEDYSQEDVAYLPGTYDWDFEEGPFFEDVALEVTEKAFQEACVRLKPLLERFPIQHLAVGIDIYGMEGYPTILHFGTNVGENGKATASFMMQPVLLEELLTVYFDENYVIKPQLLQQFDMALIHSMDYLSGQYLPLPDASVNPLTHLVFFLSGLRQVGMNKLVSSLQHSESNEISNGDPISTDELVKDFGQGNDLFEKTNLFIQKLAPSIYKNAALIMLQAIRIDGSMKGDIQIAHLVEKVMNSPGNVISREEGFQLISYVLEMKNEEFLLAIGKSDNIYPGGIINKVFKILYADQQENAQAYAAVITADAQEKVESLTSSFYESNEGLAEEQVLSQEYLNRELKSISHDESGLLELAEKLYVG